MVFACRCGSVLLGAVVLLAHGFDRRAMAAPERPEKGKDDTYSKKLVGTWEAMEPAKDGGKAETITIEFKADGNLKLVMGPFELTGTWKSVKEEGKTLTVETEATLAGFDGKAQKKTFSVVFEDANTIVMSRTGEKPDPKTLKRKK